MNDFFRMAINNIRTRPLRSWLTILGIVIGVFLITSLLSLGQGLKENMMQQLKMIGKDIIIIFPGEVTDYMSAFAGGMEISEKDMDIIEETKGVEGILPITFKTEVIRYEGESKPILIMGIDWKNGMNIYRDDLGFSIDNGRWPDPDKKELLVGSIVPEEVFKGIKVSDTIVIKGRNYEVAGILKSTGQKSDDSIIHMDLEAFRQITGERRGAREVMVKVKPDFDPEQVAENIKENLSDNKKRKRGEEMTPFSVLTNEKVTDIVNNIMGVVQTAVYSFAAIAVLVGGIGIMNTMYTSVKERTREVGILKAVGAKNSDIAMIFLIESGTIGLIGGLGGVLPGVALAKIVEMSGATSLFYLKASMSPPIFLFGIVFSFVVGCLSGYLPAMRAAKLKPVDALRRLE